MKVVINSVDAYDSGNYQCSVAFTAFDGVSSMSTYQPQISLVGVVDNASFIAAIQTAIFGIVGGITAEDIIWGDFNLAGPTDMSGLSGIVSSTIDGKSVGNTTLFTNNDSRDFWVSSYAILPQTITGLGTAPIVNVGKTASAYNDIDTGLSLAFASQAGQASWRTPASNFVKVANGESLVVRVATAAILTTAYTFKVLVRGVYL